MNKLTLTRQLSTARTLLQSRIFNPSSGNENNKTNFNTITKRVDRGLVKHFEVGQLYEPFDLSMARIRLDRKNAAVNSANRRKNNSSHNGIHMTDLYTHPEQLSKYLSTTGQILSREVTGLSERDQKRLAKAIRRAQSIGLLSKVHRDITFLPSKNVSHF
ncbi:hypothetical protein TBLA_0B01560 [Henningerozyma blattae CBS 6284]|uniref:Small ribosomal subunit protein bS18m n=1 Tax=Henningerozyma blattae (strain ATCC 34711 / CBS 6284 / DSM 70876 / NBRC 10599 / NRRL Y-10934 / UCD 77-7) TaxID=1071380 RepID=I2GXZ7_HENB6|nr:hypothetical protein TBLA_0B01560 [Tetrapisispora blattae CBS 6284]CCH58999.1 hypothetical protein TBLA_0B01560 [Tetrapisispora blattae CBS 6284]